MSAPLLFILATYARLGIRAHLLQIQPSEYPRIDERRRSIGLTVMLSAMFPLFWLNAGSVVPALLHLSLTAALCWFLVRQHGIGKTLVAGALILVHSLIVLICRHSGMPFDNVVSTALSWLYFTAFVRLILQSSLERSH